MNDEKQPACPPKPTGALRQKTGAEIREERLKAALKANMARRKAQARARTGQITEKGPTTDTGPAAEKSQGQ